MYIILIVTLKISDSDSNAMFFGIAISVPYDFRSKLEDTIVFNQKTYLINFLACHDSLIVKQESV